MPNFFAYFALLAWPLVALCLYRSLPVAQATLWTVLGGQLLLPVDASIKIEMVPEIGKFSVVSLSALLGSTFLGRTSVELRMPFRSITFIAVVYILSPIVTSLLNGDVVYSGGSILPGVGLYDG